MIKSALSPLAGEGISFQVDLRMTFSVLMPLLVVLAAAAASWLFGIVVNRLLLHYQIIDRPNWRSSHSLPTARGGGIAIIITVIAASFCLASRWETPPLLAIALCTLALAIVSFADDLKSIKVSIRLGCHVLAAVIGVIALVSSTPLGFSPGEGIIVPEIGTGVLGCLWVVGYTNAFNFMDGINGIATNQARITGVGMALLAAFTLGKFSGPPVLLSLVISGAALGFLPYNFPSARMFMGDVGSAPLGFLLAVLVLWLGNTAGNWLLIPLVLLHANFVLDTAITLVRRILRGERWYEAHREHFYQRLVQSGKSHAFVTDWELGLQAIVLGLMVLYLWVGGPLRACLAATVILIWLAFFAFCEIEFRRHGSERPSEARSHACLTPEI